jgi:ABC-2 type transport system ATP-binding protein
MSGGVEVIGLGRDFGRVTAVADLSFVVRPGELVGLVGPNGAGKSTTLKILTGQLAPTRGVARVGGVDVSQDPNGARAMTGVVPEDPQLFEYLTAREMVSFAARVRGAPTDAVEPALELSGLGEDADRLIREYSQGMRRKTALAAALVAKPPVLLLDEALNGLDPPSSARVVRALRAHADGGGAVLLSTHVLDTLERVADRVVLIAGGRVHADVPTDRLDEVRDFFDGWADGGRSGGQR